MQVLQVEDGIVVKKPNCPYIIPPTRDMVLLDCKLHLLAQGAPHGTVRTGHLCAVPW